VGRSNRKLDDLVLANLLTHCGHTITPRLKWDRMTLSSESTSTARVACVQNKDMTTWIHGFVLAHWRHLISNQAQRNLDSSLSVQRLDDLYSSWFEFERAETEWLRQMQTKSEKNLDWIWSAEKLRAKQRYDDLDPWNCFSSLTPLDNCEPRAKKSWFEFERADSEWLV
jgi:hypothetical protein